MKHVTRIATIAFAAFAATTALKANNNAETQELTVLQNNFNNTDDSSVAAPAATGGKNVVSGGKKAVVPVASASAPQFEGFVTMNYDSLYMFRGVNMMPNAGILSWTADAVWNVTPNDTISLPIWYGTAVGKTQNLDSGAFGPAHKGYLSPGYGLQNFRELDIPIDYTHKMGNWAVGAGYTLYSFYNAAPAGFPQIFGGGPLGAQGQRSVNFKSNYGPAQQAVMNEVNEHVAYTFKTPLGTITPSLTYFQQLGTSTDYSNGWVNAGSTYLSPSIASHIPLTFIAKSGAVSFNPNTQLNYSFRYNDSYNPNFKATPGHTNPHPYTGFNNWEFQLPVTWQITKTWSATAYWAYSYQNANLIGTANSQGWAGASVGASF
jgi:hypothetical protein